MYNLETAVTDTLNDAIALLEVTKQPVTPTSQYAILMAQLDGLEDVRTLGDLRKGMTLLTAMERIRPYVIPTP